MKPLVIVYASVIQPLTHAPITLVKPSEREREERMEKGGISRENPLFHDTIRNNLCYALWYEELTEAQPQVS